MLPAAVLLAPTATVIDDADSQERPEAIAMSPLAPDADAPLLIDTSPLTADPVTPALPAATSPLDAAPWLAPLQIETEPPAPALLLPPSTDTAPPAMLPLPPTTLSEAQLLDAPSVAPA